MAYSKIFDPDLVTTANNGPPMQAVADRANVYLYSDSRLVLAINIALAINRPLVLRGAPGCGKSSLARDVAHRLGWSYLEEVITSRTRAQDLLWKFDAVSRLADAQTGARHITATKQDAMLGQDCLSRNSTEPSLARYITPGVLWRAFDSESAERWSSSFPAATPVTQPPAPSESLAAKRRAVLLLDEIDKADPDVPNDLLVALGALRFVVAETGFVVEADAESAPFVIITSNDERELPTAFLRRCVVLEMKVPDTGWLIKIARRHYPEADPTLLDQLALRFVGFRDAATTSLLRSPGTAEFLDAVLACTQLRITADDPMFMLVTKTTLWKHSAPPDALPTGDDL